MLRAGELDVAVIHHYPPSSRPRDRTSRAPSWGTTRSPWYPAGHPLARWPRVPVGSLADEAFLFPRSREGVGGAYDRLMRGACAVAGFEPHILFEINDCATVQGFVAAGLGVAVLPRLALDPIHPGVVVRELSDAPSRRVLAARLAGAAPSAIADAAVALLREAAESR